MSLHLAVDRDHSLQLLPAIETVLVGKLRSGFPAGLVEQQELRLELLVADSGRCRVLDLGLLLRNGDHEHHRLEVAFLAVPLACLEAESRWQ